MFGAGRIIQELRNRLAKLSKNISHEKSIFGLGNINERVVIMAVKRMEFTATQTKPTSVG
jgi:predicted DNA-binding protein